MINKEEPKEDYKKCSEFLRKRNQRLKSMRKAKKNKGKDKGGFFFLFGVHSG